MADRVVPLTYAWWGTQIWNDIYNYKKPDEEVARDGRIRLMKLGWWGTIVHGRCIESLAPGMDLTMVTVPSTKGRTGVHPIERIARLFPDTWPRTTARPSKAVGRAYDPIAFILDDPASVENKHTIVFDDTWATGARAQSLATTVRVAGAAYVTVLVLANHLKPSVWPPLADFRQKHPSLGWSVDQCPVRDVTCLAALT